MLGQVQQHNRCGFKPDDSRSNGELLVINLYQ